MDDKTAKFILQILERQGGDYSDELLERAMNAAALSSSPASTDMIRKMRRIGKNSHHSKAWIFLRQGKFMENYEDNYPKHHTLFHYRPTYSELSDGELRTYFTWRTSLRRGDIKKTDASYAYLYIYELLNLIGAESPEDAFEKLLSFWNEYSKLDSSIGRYISFWLPDFAAYYSLDSSFAMRSVLRSAAIPSGSISVLRRSGEHSLEEVFSALSALSTYNAAHYRFFKDYPEDFINAAAGAYIAYDKYYFEKHGESYADKIFLEKSVSPHIMFQSAVFFDRVKHENYSYKVDDFLSFYTREVNNWFVENAWIHTGPSKELGDFMRAVDSIMRKVYSYPNATKNPSSDEALNEIIKNEAEALLAERRKPITMDIAIDSSLLGAIRESSEKTFEMLTEYEDEDYPDLTYEDEIPSPDQTQKAEDTNGASLLSSDERAFLRSLIYGESFSPPPGVMLSILSESVNEKLFDLFSDNVIDFVSDAPQIFEDYTEDLKKLV